MSAKKKTVSALQECASISGDARQTAFHLEEVDIPVAASPKLCDHEKSVCGDCATTWHEMFLFTERLPWERRAS